MKPLLVFIISFVLSYPCIAKLANLPVNNPSSMLLVAQPANRFVSWPKTVLVAKMDIQESNYLLKEMEETQAFLRDPISDGEFCCDREKTNDLASGISQQESQMIVNRVLQTGTKKRKRKRKQKPSAPSSGQR